jgi:predicted nucleotidyltransferase
MAVTTKEEVFTLLRRNDAHLRRFGVVRLGLFGSFARGEPNGESDVDILVEFAPGQKSFDNFMRLADFLEEILGRKTLDENIERILIREDL